MDNPKLAGGEHINSRKWRIIGFAPLLIAAVVTLSFFKGCTGLGRHGKESVYDPNAAGEGFVSKANLVLKQLLDDDCVDATVDAVNIETLNKRYRALEFALPYGEDGNAYVEASNLRLVAIHPEYIKDEKLRRFYYNSRLPQLLEQQNEHPNETYFNIRYKGGKPLTARQAATADTSSTTVFTQVRPLEISSIKLVAPMFKVRLAKSPWTGIITSRENCLFTADSTVFLTYGNSVLPLHNEPRFESSRELTFKALTRDGTLVELNNKPIDYYEYQRRTFTKGHEPFKVCISLYDDKHEQTHLNIAYANGRVRLQHPCALVVVGSQQARTFHGQSSARNEVTEVPFEDGMKILVYNEDPNQLSTKLAEFSLYSHNPTRVLSHLMQSSTGTTRYFASPSQTDLFTQQLLRGLSQHMTNRENVDTVSLSIDPLLSREFENEITNYVKNVLPRLISVGKPRTQRNEQYDMSVTIMDLATGEVLATPFYTTQFDKADYPEALKLTTRNAALSRRSIGSTFKPIEALAAVMTLPSTLDMNTTSPSRYGPPDWTADRVRFYGRTTKPWARNTSHWGGCDFTTFLSRSDDVYPVALVALALAAADNGGSTTTLPTDRDSYFTMRNGLLSFKSEERGEAMPKPESQNFIHNLSYLFGVNWNEQESDWQWSRTADTNVFDGLLPPGDEHADDEERTFGLREVAPEPTQLNIQRFLDGEDFHDLLMPWVLGQGDNMWSCIKTAEAWARMVGKRDVHASFLHNPGNGNAPSLVGDDLRAYGSVGHDINDTWNKFLGKFQAAQRGGTLSKMHNAVRSLDSTLVLLSKTGTPDAYARYEFPMLGGRNRYMDLGMYSFALMSGKNYNRVRDNKPAQGIVCVVRVTRTYECTACRPGSPCRNCAPYWGLRSDHARDFFAASPQRLRKLRDMTANHF